MKIKANSVQNLTDARYFAAWNVTWMGFSLEPGTEHYCAPKDVQEIKEWVVGPKFVGEFGLSQTEQEIRAAVELLQLDAVQVPTYADTALLTALQDLTVIKEYVLGSWSDLPQVQEHCRQFSDLVPYFYLNAERGGLSWANLQENPAQLELLRQLCEEYAILLSVHCPPTELGALIDQIAPHALNVQGGEEEVVGMKSFDDLDAFFETLEDLDLIEY